MFANDLDLEVYNLYKVLKRKKSANQLINELELLPIHSEIWKENKKYKEKKLSNVKRAMYFLLYSNFGYMGKGDTLNFGFDNSKRNLLNNINNFLKNIVNNPKTSVNFLNYSYENVLSKISIRNEIEGDKVFVFADPPYVDTGNNYNTPVFTINDHAKLQKHLIDSGLNFMICEFNNPQILELAKKNNLYVTEIGERTNMKNRRVEIIITNYKPTNYVQQSMF
jgi:DNA adenine methylase